VGCGCFNTFEVGCINPLRNDLYNDSETMSWPTAVDENPISHASGRSAKAFWTLEDTLGGILLKVFGWRGLLAVVVFLQLLLIVPGARSIHTGGEDQGVGGCMVALGIMLPFAVPILVAVLRWCMLLCGFDPFTADTLGYFISPYYVSLASILATLELSVLLLMHGSQCIQGGGEGGECWGGGGTASGAGMLVGGLLAPMVLSCCGLLVDDEDEPCIDTGMIDGSGWDPSGDDDSVCNLWLIGIISTAAAWPLALALLILIPGAQCIHSGGEGGACWGGGGLGSGIGMVVSAVVILSCCSALVCRCASVR
jgi:hypothetical protein